MYTVLAQFKDIDGEVYNVGDTYPRKCLTDKRIWQLSTSNNKEGRPFIAAGDASMTEDDLPDFASMTEDDLLAYAADNGIAISSQVTKKDTMIRHIHEYYGKA